MKIIARPRGAGKTYEVIMMMRRDPKILLITFAYKEAERLKTAYEDVADRIIPWQDYQDRREVFRDNTLAIDNAEMILQRFVHNPIEALTITDDDTPVRAGLSRLQQSRLHKAPRDVAGRGSKIQDY